MIKIIAAGVILALNGGTLIINLLKSLKPLSIHTDKISIYKNCTVIIAFGYTTFLSKLSIYYQGWHHVKVNKTPVLFFIFVQCKHNANVNAKC